MNVFKNLAALIFLAAFVLATSTARAEGGSKDPLLEKLEPITVNLLGPARKYVQVEVALKLANPELGETIKTYMPVIRHKLILLLTSKEPEQLGSTAGKLKFIQESRKAINQALGLTDKNGVTDVLFGSFIIQ